MAEMRFNLVHNFRQKRRWLEVDSRDAYGFALRPQHVQRYREYLNIYKEEEAERAEKWKNFLERQDGPSESCSSEEEFQDTLQVESVESGEETASEEHCRSNDSRSKKHDSDCYRESEPAEELLLPKDGTLQTSAEIPRERDLKKEHEAEKLVRDSEELLSEETEPGKEKQLSEERGFDKEQKISKEGEPAEQLQLRQENESKNCQPNLKEDGPEQKEEAQGETKTHKVQKWAQISPTLAAIETMKCSRVKKAKHVKNRQRTQIDGHLQSINESTSFREGSKENSVEDAPNSVSSSACSSPKKESDAHSGISREPFFPWEEELAVLVRLGVPRELRGEVWQAFVGVKARRVERYYQDLLAQISKSDESNEQVNPSEASRKWKRQIEKDIPRTFPGHPALNDDGRDSLRRILLAYACHNPSVGYCQAMNFFAGLLLLLMPEENAFWTLVGVVDDYFDGYYTEEMIESQVDQLVFEELMRERFPKLVNHLDYLGVQVAWISGPWFLSIFVNLLPWESVLRMWDVLLFEGNRVMLFRTALALMEFYGPALVTTKDAGDAIVSLQNLTGSTFDSSQLVLTACMGYLSVTEARLKELRQKHRPAVLEVVKERTKRGQVWKDTKGLASKLYSFKHERSVLDEKRTTKRTDDEQTTDQDNSCSQNRSLDLDELIDGINADSESDSLPDLQEQVVWMKVELCRLLEEKRSAELRAEELETALMEMAQEDNRRELSAQIEQLENEVTELRQVLADKKQQETAMLQVLMKVEEEQKLTEDARISAEQDAAAQRYAVHMLEEKYEKAMTQIAEMEKRVKIAESMLEATLQYESGQSKALASPRFPRNQVSAQDSPKKKTGFLSFGIGWRDRNKESVSRQESKSHRESNLSKESKAEDHLHNASKS